MGQDLRGRQESAVTTLYLSAPLRQAGVVGQLWSDKRLAIWSVVAEEFFMPRCGATFDENVPLAQGGTSEG